MSPSPATAPSAGRDRPASRAQPPNKTIPAAVAAIRTPTAPTPPPIIAAIAIALSNLIIAAVLAAAIKRFAVPLLPASSKLFSVLLLRVALNLITVLVLITQNTRKNTHWFHLPTSACRHPPADIHLPTSACRHPPADSISTNRSASFPALHPLDQLYNLRVYHIVVKK
jgi:hypothetical protein